MTHVTILMSKDLSLFVMLSFGNSFKVREALKLLWNSGLNGHQREQSIQHLVLSCDHMRSKLLLEQ